jgi:glutamate dehydrogenase/leucine dehydrogenase
MSAHLQDPLALSPSALAAALRAEGVSRFCFTTDPVTGGARASHALLAPVAAALSADRVDFEGHEGLFFEVSALEDVIHGAFVHRTRRGQAQGGTRFWGYDRFAQMLNDGVRLSKGMTHKNALAGLWWGGGKGVISRPASGDITDPARRAALFEEYGRFISSLRGCYITAEDVGTNTSDMASVANETRFITCIPKARGGSGNPSGATALGVVRGLEAAFAYAEGAREGDADPSRGALKGKVVVVQGAGNVGEVIISLLLERGARVRATDISAARLDALAARLKPAYGDALELTRTEPGDLSPLAWPCDALCPAAMGAVLTPATIAALQTSIVCGAANNQLQDPARDGAALSARGVTYLPDFLVNRMGIVNCANEQYGYVGADPSADPYFARHLGREWAQSVYQTSLRVLARAEGGATHPHAAAVALADELSREAHPVWGHRGQQIISALVAEGWAEGRA